MLSPDPNPKGNGQKETVLSGILEAIVPLFFLALNLVIYWQVTHYGFLNYLDDADLVNNPHVRGGISSEGAAWCFRIFEKGGWSPLTWLSHMLDFNLYRLNPGSHHLTSLFFHTVNTMLLFLVLRRATGALWPSVFVAVVFAVHPLNVESVAWVSERKGVLSAFFLFASLWNYVLYAEKPGPSRYFMCLLLFALGLMAGPVALSLPLLLLIMDYWPLNRLRFKSEEEIPVLRQRDIGRHHLVLEKVPFLALAAFSAAMTFFALRHGENLPLEVSFTRIPLSYVVSLWKILWPHPLSVFYEPFEAGSVWMAAGAGFLVMGVSVLVILLWRVPYLAAGWFWYVVSLTPVIAFGDAGGWPVMADRFMYVPVIGIIIIVAWGCTNVVERLGYGRFPLALGAGLLLLVMMMTTWSQLKYWQKSLTLFSHAVTVSPKNAVARNYLGFALAREGKYAEAMNQLTEALRLKSDYPEAHLNLGLVLDEQGRFQEAIRHFSEAVSIDPNSAKAHAHWAMALTRKGFLQEAKKHYSEALKIDPEDAEVHNNLGVTLYGEGKLQEAMHHYSEALRIRPEYADAQKNLAYLLRFMGQIPDEPARVQASPP
jgi:protein O-mannosyl-transferase